MYALVEREEKIFPKGQITTGNVFTVNETGRGWQSSKKTMRTVIGKWAEYTNRVHKGNRVSKQGYGKCLNLPGIEEMWFLNKKESYTVLMKLLWLEDRKRYSSDRSMSSAPYFSSSKKCCSFSNLTWVALVYGK